MLVQRFAPAGTPPARTACYTGSDRVSLASNGGTGGETRMTDAPITRCLDLRGLKCPMPVLRTRRALSALQAGTRLDVLCTDPLAVIDLPHLLRETGDTLLASTGEAGFWRFSIMKA